MGISCFGALKSIWKAFLTAMLGCVFWFVVGTIVIINLPVYLYRILLTKIIAPCFHPWIGKVIALGSTGMATDFLQSNLKSTSRNGVVVNTILEGTLSFEEIQEKLETGWLSAKYDRGQLLYPEFQSYIEHWMGFMFWKPDTGFKIDNHLKLHTLEEDVNDENCEEFVRSLVEELLNTQFISKRSPWKLHVLHNYRNESLHNGPMTMLMMHLCHSMADGPSFITVFREGLLGLKPGELKLALRDPAEVRVTSPQGLHVRFFKLFQSFAVFVRDSGFILSLFFRRNVPWLINEKKKTNRQLYGRSNLIPIGRVKDIKNEFGSSFTAVLLACMSAEITKTLKGSAKQHVDKMVVGLPIPLRNRSMKLKIKNTATATAERLMKCHQILKTSMNSAIPLMGIVLTKVGMPLLAPFARMCHANCLFPTYLTSFPGPAEEVRWHGRNKLLGGDYGVGLVTGMAGVGFVVLSIQGHLRIAVTAEARALEREELTQLINYIEMEFEELYSMQCV